MSMATKTIFGGMHTSTNTKFDGGFSWFFYQKQNNNNDIEHTAAD